MRKIIYILLILLLCSCGTTKNSQHKTKSKEIIVQGQVIVNQIDPNKKDSIIGVQSSINFYKTDSTIIDHFDTNEDGTFIRNLKIKNIDTFFIPTTLYF